MKSFHQIISECVAIRHGASEETKIFFPLILVDADDEGKQAAERRVRNMSLEELDWRTSGFASWLQVDLLFSACPEESEI